MVLAFTLAVFLAWSSIRAALARYYFEQGTFYGFERATRLEPQNAQYWHLLGRYFYESVDQQNLPKAINSFRISLALDPRSADTWLDLASVYESEGDIAAARTAFLQPKRLYPASADVTWRYGNFLLRQNEVTTGMLEIRHAVEHDPKRGVAAFFICRRFEPRFDAILDQLLPPVSSIYVDLLWQLAGERDFDKALKIWSRLVAQQPKLHEREVRFFVDGLLNSQRAVQAQTVWKQALTFMDVPKTGDPAGSLIWDGGFETNLINGGLAWRIEPYKTVRVGYDQLVKHSGTRALRIDISQGDISDFVGVCEFVVVEPNTAYEFSAWMRTRDLAETGGVLFRLIPDIQGSQVATSPKLGGTNDWTRVSVPWTSPDHSHLSRVCLSRKPAFQQVPATVWVDDVSLVKVHTPAMDYVDHSYHNQLSVDHLYSWSKRRTLASTLLESPLSRHDWKAAQYVGLKLPSPYLSGNLEPANVIRVL